MKVESSQTVAARFKRISPKLYSFVIPEVHFLVTQPKENGNLLGISFAKEKEGRAMYSSLKNQGRMFISIYLQAMKSLFKKKKKKKDRKDIEIGLPFKVTLGFYVSPEWRRIFLAARFKKSYLNNYEYQRVAMSLITDSVASSTVSEEPTTGALSERQAVIAARLKEAFEAKRAELGHLSDGESTGWSGEE